MYKSWCKPGYKLVKTDSTCQSVSQWQWQGRYESYEKGATHFLRVTPTFTSNRWGGRPPKSRASYTKTGHVAHASCSCDMLSENKWTHMGIPHNGRQREAYSFLIRSNGGFLVKGSISVLPNTRHKCVLDVKTEPMGPSFNCPIFSPFYCVTTLFGL
jgi:hypothetical protein